MDAIARVDLVFSISLRRHSTWTTLQLGFCLRKLRKRPSWYTLGELIDRSSTNIASRRGEYTQSLSHWTARYSRKTSTCSSPDWSCQLSPVQDGERQRYIQLIYCRANVAGLELCRGLILLGRPPRSPPASIRPSLGESLGSTLAISDGIRAGKLRMMSMDSLQGQRGSTVFMHTG